MRANREDIQPVSERRQSQLPLVAAAAAVVLAIPLYFVFRDPGDQGAAEQPAAMPVVRDSAIVAPPVVDAPVQQPAPQAQASTATQFPERRLAPEVPTVSAGTAPVIQRAGDDESLVIDGPLLQEIEEDAAENAPASIQ